MKTYNNIPAELRKLNQWVCQKNKVPYNVFTDKFAKSTDPSTWASFDVAANASGYDGIAFAITAGNDLICVDLDTVRDPQTGNIDPIALDIVKKIGSYTEISPSGYGLHIWVYAKVNLTWHRKKLPDNGIRRLDTDSKNGGIKCDSKGIELYKHPEIEMYDDKRIMTVTGDVLDGYSTLRSNADAIEAIQMQFASPPVTRNPTVPAAAIEQDCIKHGLQYPRFRALWDGQRPHQDESRDDLALMNYLAFYANRDACAMIEAFKASPHYQTKDLAHIKKAQRPDYLLRTAQKAIDDCSRTAADNMLVSPTAPAATPHVSKPEQDSPCILDIIAPLTNFEECEAKWLVEDLIPAGQITILASDGGVGKTTLACSLAAAISSGTRCILDPTDVAREPQKVLLLNAEDSIRAKLAKKLRLNHATKENILAPDTTADKAHLESSMKIGSPEFEQVIRHVRPALCIIDPLQSYIPPHTNMSSRAEMRQCLQHLTALGEDTGCAFVVVCHTNKRKGASGRNRISESSDLWDLARSVLMMGFTDDSNVRYISNEKNNYAEPQPTILFSINDDVPCYIEETNLKDADYIAIATMRSVHRKPDEPINQALIDAVLSYASDDIAKVPYQLIAADYGEQIWGTKRPKSAIDAIQHAINLAGYTVQANYTMKIKGKSTKGILLSRIPAATEE